LEGLPPGHRLDFAAKPRIEDLDALADGLEASNERHWPGHQPWQEYAFLVRDAAGAVAAGIAGHTYAGWMFVQYLWVAEGLRDGGIGRGLMAEAERLAVVRGCHSAFLDTFSFQARGFYEKLGYEVFAELDYPPGHARYFLRRRFGGGGGSAPQRVLSA
jgi:GNAT superfamily N-acetyltransferase